MTDRLALPRRYRDQLEALLREHVPGVEVWAYGSRVNGESHDGSDLDLALRGPALEPLDGGFNDLLEAIEKSTIPILVQAHDWARLPESFHREIERDYVVVQEGAKQTAANSWREVALGDVAEIVMGQSPPGDKVSGDNGLALLNGPTEFGASHPTPVQFTIDARKYAQPGDILFCVRGSTTGRMNWADQEYAIGRGVAAIRHKNDSALQPFVRGVIELGLSELLAQATGSTFPNVSAQQLAEIPYPSLDEDEQRAIAHILGTLDDKIELNRRMNRTLEEMARAIFQDWFVDFGPTRAKMGGQEPYLPPELWDLFPDELVDSELGEIPEGWEVGVLHDAIEILSGGTPKTSIPEYWNENIPWYTAKDAPDPSDVFVVNTERSITPAGVANSSTQVLPTGTTIITARGTVGRLACLGIPMAMNQTCYGIRGADGYPEYFTYWNVRNTVSDLQSRTHGTIFDTITRDTFKIADAVLAPAEVACAFDEIVNPLMSRILGNLTESSQLKLQRESLLPRLISGEVSAVSLG